MAHTDIDFDKDGKQVSFVNIPYSPHSDAWGVLCLPLAVIRNGTGPTVLLLGGIHGDEYEGPVTLGRLIRGLDPAGVRGRLIILPAANLPAVQAGQRTSPEDGWNMNRTFPGDAQGSITFQLSHYLDTVLFPMADVFMDLHSGGSSLDLVPAAIMQTNDDAALTRRIREAVLAFDAPLTVKFDTYGEARTSMANALRHGLVAVGTELGSAGMVSRDGLHVCERGVYNVLDHFGVVARPPHVAPRGQGPSRMMEVARQEGFTYAPADGVWESYHEKGTWVEAGQEAGCIHFLDDPARPPAVARFGASGMLFCRRAPGRARRGNCVAIVVRDAPDAA